MNSPSSDYDKFGSIAPEVAGFVIRSCLELKRTNDFKTNLDGVIQNLREYTDSNSAVVVTVNLEKKKAKIFSQNSKPGLYGGELLSMKVPYDIVKSWEALIGDNDCFLMKDRGDIDIIEEASPEWARLLKAEDAASLCLVPLNQNMNRMGYLLITNFDVERISAIQETLEIFSLFLSSEIANYQFLKRLEWLTSVDMRTGVRNRSVMNRVVDEYVEKLKWQKMPIGVVFCMMNGLKYLNKTVGHDEGNKCLEEAGEILLEVFDEKEVFRSGGEEFVVITENPDKQDFEEKIEKLRELGSNPEGVYFAIGSYYDNEDGDLRHALRLSSKQMLEEKEAFYEKYPEKKIK